MAQAITGAKAKRRGTTPRAAKMPAVTKGNRPAEKADEESGLHKHNRATRSTPAGDED